jgi:hypothetical protein
MERRTEMGIPKRVSRIKTNRRKWGDALGYFLRKAYSLFVSLSFLLCPSITHLNVIFTFGSVYSSINDTSPTPTKPSPSSSHHASQADGDS